MKAAIVTGAGKTPIYGEFNDAVVHGDEELITVRAAALSNVTRSRASGVHYSAAGVYPAVAGVDGVGLMKDGTRVYFAMPEAPWGALAELCPMHPRRCVDIPDALDDITAAAIANPGMSAWAALMERSHFTAGETVLVHGATGTAGRIAVQLAKYLGAARVIATGRNVEELEELRQLGADVTIPFALGPGHAAARGEFEEALAATFQQGIDVVIDYLWGESALMVIAALAKTVAEKSVRFVHVGSASGERNIELPGAALRSAAITLMGSGVGSVSRKGLVQSVRHVFEAVAPAGLKIATKSVPLADVASVWDSAKGKPRVVFTIG
ncbi:zinc-binding alcohol dehydrogenase family protein [Acidipila sp. EB88]|uniref:quinone oxidoreductase family protein n=1 Tax=Acidipila sp. EB88 TaxID=2305226 RepID=UPI000F5F0341|nr:zinc-binding alcohol dehydrogenase family protein [Acidipila sp. EB88]RRA49765.1 zinc-binding alcohol dehydrogenase family protein [Acidipila sp. EB88]